MRLAQLQYFLDVARTQNMSRSAKNLHVAQPSLSRAVHELESELNTPLFTRNGRSLALNEAGRRFEVTASTALQTLYQGVQDLHRFLKEDAEQVTIRIESSTTMIPGLLAFLHQELPDIHIHLIQHGLQNDALAPYDFQLVTRPAPANENRFLLSEEIHIGTAIDSPLAKRCSNGKVTVPQLWETPLITTEPNPLREQVLRTLRASAPMITPTFVTGDRATIAGMVRSGVGINYFPEHSWPQVDTSGIKMLTVLPTPLKREIYLSMPKRSVRSPQHELVKSSIVAYFQQL